MKSVTVPVVALLLSFALCACAEPAEPRGEVIVNTTQSAPETTQATEEPAGLSIGETAGQTYQNAFIGIGCTLPEEWTFYTDEQIRELNAISAELAGEEYQKALEAATVIYDMYVIHDNGMDSINVNLEKINGLYLATLDLKENMENAAGMLEQALGNMGYTDFTYRLATTAIEDEEFVCMDTVSRYDDIIMYQRLISVKCNGYLANITVTTFDENRNDILMESFFLTD